MSETFEHACESETQQMCQQEALRAEIAEIERQRDIFLQQRDAFEAETKRLYAGRADLESELHEVERQRDVFLQQRDAFEAETKRLYAGRANLESELHEVERQRDVFLQQRDQFEEETTTLYAGHRALMEEINFLKYRCEETSKLHEQVVLRNWTGEGCRKEYFCTQPFERIEILPRGEVYTCCSGTLKSGYDIGNIYQQDFEEIWNSERAKRLRYSVTKGDFEYCHEYCLYLAQRDQAVHGEIHPVRKKDGKTFQYSCYQDCTVNEYPKVIALSCDETCNLQCPSCRNARKALSKEKSSQLLEMLMAKVRPLMPSCRMLKVLGSGEVFASAACSAFLKTLTVEECPNLAIYLITNAQLFTKERWGEFKNLDRFPLLINISIDAAQKQTYEKLRLGGKWETLLNNLDFIAQLRKAGNARELIFNFVVQLENYRQIPEFVELGKRYAADAVYFQFMTNWGTTSQEDYQRNNVFYHDNPHRQEAEQLLKEAIRTASGIRVQQNILDIGF